MDRKYRVGKPKEGLNTLVARFSFTHFMKATDKIKKLQAEGVSGEAILEELKSTLQHADPLTRKNIAQLAVGLHPKDNIESSEISDENVIKEGTVEIELRDERSDLEAGAVVFFEGRRWVIASVKEGKLVLKHF